jgi:hypothetical protein
MMTTVAALLLTALACTPVPTCATPEAIDCATPTPMLQWDAVETVDLESYLLYVREDGGPLTFVTALPCEWADLDLDDDGLLDTRVCRGADIAIPVQRYCATCAPFGLYEFAVKARDLLGRESVLYSNPVVICTTPIWQWSDEYN